MLDFVQTVFDGMLFGATYSLVAVGLTLIFGVMGKLNMSYVGGAAVAAYAAMTCAKSIASFPLILLIPAACTFGAISGILVYLACFRFIAPKFENASLMATIGLMLLLDELIVDATKGMPQSFPAIFPDNIVEIGAFNLRVDLALVFVLCMVSMGALIFVVYHTRFGVALRAVAQQPAAARLCGIRVDRVNAGMFALTGALGGAAVALVCSVVGTLSILLVQPVTVKGLIATVIGGLGNVPGAIIAGMLLGGFENAFQHFRGVTERDIFVMLLLFAFLMMKPGGLFAPKPGRD